MDYACFKAYDVRGRVPEELDEQLCRDLGLVFAREFAASRVVIGMDVRHSGPALSAALADGLMSGGADVTHIGVCGTEEIYHAATQGFDGGIMVTASHNPQGYNGLKLVRGGALPISGDSGLFALRDKIKELREKGEKVLRPGNGRKGGYQEASFRRRYLESLISETRRDAIRPLKIVMNSGNGCAGPVAEALASCLPGCFVFLHSKPDGNFPNGIPNPLLPECRADTANAVRKHKADLGLAWDGDFDRCFFYDADGNFIESYYIVGLLAKTLLATAPGSKILYDSRLTWNTIEMVKAAGGIPLESKTGHAFMKERMRRENALYGGEMSAHHYFRSFSYCDSGMLPWLRLLELLGQSGQGLRELVEDRMKAFPCSGEINRKVADAAAATLALKEHFKGQIREESHIDGLSIDCGNWRCNLRSSNTEPLLRLNMETRGDQKLLAEKLEEALAVIDKFAE